MFKATPCSRGGGPSEKKLLHGKLLSSSSFLHLRLSLSRSFANDSLSGMPISVTLGVTYPRSNPRVSFFFSFGRPGTTGRTTSLFRRRVFGDALFHAAHTTTGYVSGEQDRLLTVF